MSYFVAQWPFWMPEARTPEENERWWVECYLRPAADVTLRGVSRSVIVSGAPGSGKTTLLQAFEREEAARYLIVRYPVARWPGEEHVWVKGYGHLGQIMACASMAVKRFLDSHPDKPAQLSKTNLEYLRWLIEKYSGRRAVQRWGDALNFQPLLDMLEQPFDDIYPTDFELPDVQGQIEELVTLSHRLGFENGTAILVDIDDVAAANERVLAKIEDLFGWLTPLQFEGFAVKAVMPETVIEKTNLIYKSRGRVSFTALHWEDEDCRRLSARYLHAAGNGRWQNLNDIASDELLDRLYTAIYPFCGGALPRVSVRLTRLLLNTYLEYQQPLDIKQYEDILRAYFATYIPLKLDKSKQGVWQGEKFIPLDEQPFRLLEVLWQYTNSDYNATDALMRVAVHRGNLNTLAARLRKKLEPVPSRPVYIRNTRSRGYWLENFAVQ